MPKPRPATVVMIAFATGSVTIQCAKGKAEVKALMNVPHFKREYAPRKEGEEPKLLGEYPVEIIIPSISETDVKGDPRSAEIQYRLTNEEIGFNRKDVVFWSVAEAVDPPMVQEVPVRIVAPR